MAESRVLVPEEAPLPRLKHIGNGSPIRAHNRDALSAARLNKGSGCVVISDDGRHGLLHVVPSFILNALFRFLTRCWLAALRRLGKPDVNLCHGDRSAMACKGVAASL